MLLHVKRWKNDEKSSDVGSKVLKNQPQRRSGPYGSITGRQKGESRARHFIVSSLHSLSPRNVPVRVKVALFLRF